MSRKVSLQQQVKEGKELVFKGSKTVRHWCVHSHGGGQTGAACGPGGSPMRLAAPPFSTQALAPGCPLSAGLQVLVHEHVEFTVHPTTFIPAEEQ